MGQHGYVIANNNITNTTNTIKIAVTVTVPTITDKITILVTISIPNVISCLESSSQSAYFTSERNRCWPIPLPHLLILLCHVSAHIQLIPNELGGLTCSNQRHHSQLPHNLLQRLDWCHVYFL